MLRAHARLRRPYRAHRHTYQSARYLLDLGAPYAVNKAAGLYLNLKNLTNAGLRYREGPDNRSIRREFYGLTI